MPSTAANGHPLSLHCITLVRRDIIAFETRLMEHITRFIGYKGHSISFPKDRKKRAAKWIEEEGKLLLPLIDQRGLTLGVFIASNANPVLAPFVAQNWEAIGSLITDNLLLYKISLCDPSTGLFSRHFLLDSIAQEITRLRSPFLASPPICNTETPAPLGKGLFANGAELLQSASFGVFVVRLNALRDVVREYGYQFTDALLTALAHALQGVCPGQAVAARTGDLEFAIHLPAATTKTCQALANTIATTLKSVQLVHPLRKEQVGISPSIGYALYPQNVQGHVFLQTDPEQAHVLLRKARLAAALAQEETSGTLHEQGAIMAFSHILAAGGKVLDVLPLSRVTVSLGSNMHAREGQRFSIWSTNYPVHGASAPTAPLAPLYKGELVLLEVHENTSNAEIIHLGDPAWNIEPKDRLTLIAEEQSAPLRTSAAHPQLDPVTGLLRHADFMAKWVEEREKHSPFCLSLIRISQVTPPEAEEMLPQTYTHAESYMGEAASFCKEILGKDAIGGRYGLTSLMFFHPSMHGNTAHNIYTQLATSLEAHMPLSVAVGIAHYPFLDYRKADTLENCQKALEYAMLLPAPHVGVVDSLALNIYADKLFSQGDTFTAIKEYKLALMADETNTLAWNSLGICLAGMGKANEAENFFIEALKHNSCDTMALYNLGYIHQSQGHEETAANYYQRCLSCDPNNLFALIRLGQLAENAEDYAAARNLYTLAASLPEGHNLTYRHFARLSVKENNPSKAREYLHDALIHDPQDAFAMQLLAKLFLDAGEDPDMAASFARQSVSLRPTFKAGWLELARALEQMGETAQAKLALSRAGEL